MTKSRLTTLVSLAVSCFATTAHAQRPRVSDLQIAPAEAKVRVGQRQLFTVTAYDAVGTPVDNATFEWSSSNPDVATIDRGGTITAVGVGLAIITARTGSGASARSAQVPVEVTAAENAAVLQRVPVAAPAPPVQRVVASVRLAPLDANLRVGQRQAFVATAYEASGSAVEGVAFEWSSSNPAVATVDQSGLTLGTGVGLAIVTARTGSGASQRAMQAPIQVTAAAAVPPTVEALPAAAPGGPARTLPPVGARPWELDTSSGSAVDFAQARGLYQRGCDGGDVAACTNVGWLLYSGRGGGQDYAQARALFQRGCDGSDLYGCALLARQYESGRGVAPDLGAAHRLFQRACELANATEGRSCFTVGLQFEFGRGVGEDPAMARTYYQRACDRGFSPGCTSLGFLYATGKGGTRDFEQARQLYQRSCDRGEARGCTNLGALYARGDGVRRDPAMARVLYQRGCDAGSAHGCYDLALLYQRGEGVSRDLPQARQLLERACSGGDRPACGLLEHGKIR